MALAGLRGRDQGDRKMPLVRHSLALGILCAVALLGSAHEPARDAAQQLPPPAEHVIEFSRDVEPLLRSRCHSCHGPEEREAGLRLDLRDAALAGGDSGLAILPGNSAGSRLIHRIAGLDKQAGRMPPDGEGTPLTREEISLLRAWIDQGAPWPAGDGESGSREDHWSFRLPDRPGVPAVANSAWCRNPIDAFILARLESERFEASPRADPATLIRRVHFDALGLPPSPDEVLAFASDPSPDAYERLVDRTLASPHYGERWGRHWLDLARYADSDGYEKDLPRPHAWRYRQWVIEALNADQPFDHFSLEQLAGDLLPEATLEQQVAAGFHRNTLHNTEGGIDPEEDRVKKTVDRTNTLGTVWLGMTVGCAQCHSHKYDPLTQREYFALYAFFNSIQEQNLPVPSPDDDAAYARAKAAFDLEHAPYVAAIRAYEQEQLAIAQANWEKTATVNTANVNAANVEAGTVENGTVEPVPEPVRAALAIAVADRSPEQRKAVADYYRTVDPELQRLQKAEAEHAKQAPPQPAPMAQSVVETVEPRETRVHLRGDFLSPGDPVPAATPSVLPSFQSRGKRPDRLDLARWLFGPSHPLTARVTVNRVWQACFGRGIVATPDDFGTQGERPSHAELLDWLAGELRDREWGLKRVQHLILSSATYQQASATRSELEPIDPQNVLLARQTRRRVEAEVVRDNALAVSGLLDRKLGGPSVRPPQPNDYAKITYANSARWEPSTGGDRYRRGLYTFFQRTSPYPMLVTFDAPDSNACTAQRSTSNTPLQALTLWNDPVFFECAQALGRRIVHEAPSSRDVEATNRQRVRYAFLVCLAREPVREELEDVLELFRAQVQLNQQATESAGPGLAPALQSGETPVMGEVSPAELAGWILVARTLMNLDEFVTRE